MHTAKHKAEGMAKEAAGYIKEEAYEHGDSPESKRKAQEGRDLRNEGRMAQGEAPLTSKPGTGHKAENENKNDSSKF